jgi:hypothetical protein
MSLLPTCVVCDALLHGYGGETLCPRCKQGCPTCGGDVAFCSHPLPEPLTTCAPDPLKHLDPLLKKRRVG